MPRPDSTNYEALRSAVTKTRLEQGLTFAELGALAGLPRYSIMRLEQGESAGMLETWVKVANGLGVSFWELAQVLDTPHSNT